MALPSDLQAPKAGQKVARKIPPVPRAVKIAAPKQTPLSFKPQQPFAQAQRQAHQEAQVVRRAIRQGATPEQIAFNRAQAKPGDQHNRFKLPFGVGTVDLTTATSKLADQALKGAGSEKQFVENAVNDVTGLPA